MGTDQGQQSKVPVTERRECAAAPITDRRRQGRAGVARECNACEVVNGIIAILLSYDQLRQRWMTQRRSVTLLAGTLILAREFGRADDDAICAMHVSQASGINNVERTIGLTDTMRLRVAVHSVQRIWTDGGTHSRMEWPGHTHAVPLLGI